MVTIYINVAIFLNYFQIATLLYNHNYYAIHYSIFHIFRIINSQCKNETDSLHFDSNDFLEPRPLRASS